jgi:hypothetical protein
MLGHVNGTLVPWGIPDGEHGKKAGCAPVFCRFGGGCAI